MRRTGAPRSRRLGPSPRRAASGIPAPRRTAARLIVPTRAWSRVAASGPVARTVWSTSSSVDHQVGEDQPRLVARVVGVELDGQPTAEHLEDERHEVIVSGQTGADAVSRGAAAREPSRAGVGGVALLRQTMPAVLALAKPGAQTAAAHARRPGRHTARCCARAVVAGRAASPGCCPSRRPLQVPPGCRRRCTCSSTAARGWRTEVQLTGVGAARLRLAGLRAADVGSRAAGDAGGVRRSGDEAGSGPGAAGDGGAADQDLASVHPELRTLSASGAASSVAVEPVVTHLLMNPQ